MERENQFELTVSSAAYSPASIRRDLSLSILVLVYRSRNTYYNLTRRPRCGIVGGDRDQPTRRFYSRVHAFGWKRRSPPTAAGSLV